jgi:hypothetical protein
MQFASLRVAKCGASQVRETPSPLHSACLRSLRERATTIRALKGLVA